MFLSGRIAEPPQNSNFVGGYAPDAQIRRRSLRGADLRLHPPGADRREPVLEGRQRAGGRDSLRAARAVRLRGPPRTGGRELAFRVEDIFQRQRRRRPLFQERRPHGVAGVSVVSHRGAAARGGCRARRVPDRQDPRPRRHSPLGRGGGASSEGDEGPHGARRQDSPR